MDEKTIERLPHPPRPHTFLNRHTVLGFFLLTGWAYLVVQGTGVIGAAPVSVLLNIRNGGVDMTTVSIATSLAAVVGGFAALLIHKAWFRWEFRGCLRLRWLGLGLLMLSVQLLSLVVGLVLDPQSLAGLTFSNLCLALMAGVTEEVIFRGIPCSYLMRQWREEKKIPLAALLSSAVFGLVHATNLFAGADPTATLVQVLYAFGLGILLAAAYLRTGNLLPPMIVHFINDVVAFLATDYVENGVQTQSFSLQDNLINLGLAALNAAVGLWLLRRSRRAQILAVWDERWSRDGAPAEPAAVEEAEQ